MAQVSAWCLFVHLHNIVSNFRSHALYWVRTDSCVHISLLFEHSHLCDYFSRFLKGAVDSEDLPLSLSREKAQNSNLVRRIKEVVTRKFLRFLSDEMKNNPASYREFYLEYHMFLKEGKHIPTLVPCFELCCCMGWLLIIVSCTILQCGFYLTVISLCSLFLRCVPGLCFHGQPLQAVAV